MELFMAWYELGINNPAMGHESHLSWVLSAYLFIYFCLFCSSGDPTLALAPVRQVSKVESHLCSKYWGFVVQG